MKLRFREIVAESAGRDMVFTVFPDVEIEVPLAEIDLDENEMDVLLERAGPVVVSGIVAVLAGITLFAVARQLSLS